MQNEDRVKAYPTCLVDPVYVDLKHPLLGSIKSLDKAIRLGWYGVVFSFRILRNLHSSDISDDIKLVPLSDKISFGTSSLDKTSIIASATTSAS